MARQGITTMRVTMTEFGQLDNYATTITGHPEVAGTKRPDSVIATRR
jgi:hypothetical protein